ncbi:MAG: hypothetical protein Edafosvirus5_64 [Edafosvirus sp.]|uniref:Uncharacterized protein n=1 Tax=Edafosvirus sp. TaxID=2487765 RepID=A0A3G4ZTB8_9VIRU|nr:MAG: hypothetical protein Edafosvirus5_64 [Edafosvirus sp.]
MDEVTFPYVEIYRLQAESKLMGHYLTKISEMCKNYPTPEKMKQVLSEGYYILNKKNHPLEKLSNIIEGHKKSQIMFTSNKYNKIKNKNIQLKLQIDNIKKIFTENLQYIASLRHPIICERRILVMSKVRPVGYEYFIGILRTFEFEYKQSHANFLSPELKQLVAKCDTVQLKPEYKFSDGSYIIIEFDDREDDLVKTYTYVSLLHNSITVGPFVGAAPADFHIIEHLAKKFEGYTNTFVTRSNITVKLHGIKENKIEIINMVYLPKNFDRSLIKMIKLHNDDLLVISDWFSSLSMVIIDINTFTVRPFDPSLPMTLLQQPFRINPTTYFMEAPPSPESIANAVVIFNTVVPCLIRDLVLVIISYL